MDGGRLIRDVDLVVLDGVISSAVIVDGEGPSDATAAELAGIEFVGVLFTVRRSEA